MPLRYTTLGRLHRPALRRQSLAVFCDQPELPTERMQAIAREFNLSETVFIVPPRDPRALRRLRIFTPTKEMQFAGHPTIGAVHTLVDAGIAGDAEASSRWSSKWGWCPSRSRDATARRLICSSQPRASGNARNSTLARGPRKDAEPAGKRRDRRRAGLVLRHAVLVRAGARSRRARPRQADSAVWSKALSGAWTAEALRVLPRPGAARLARARAHVRARPRRLRRSRHRQRRGGLRGLSRARANPRAPALTSGLWSRASRWAARASCAWKPTRPKAKSPPFESAARR